VFKSIRSRIFTAFVLLSLMLAGLGLYGVYQVSTAGVIVADLYDKPAMAINFARLASFTFSQMDSELRRERLGGEDVAEGKSRLDGLTQDLVDDLKLARERSVSGQTAALIDEIADQAHEWDSLRHRGDAGEEVPDPAEMDALSARIIDNFGRMTELSAGDGFVERESVLGAIQAARSSGIAVTAAALLFAAVIILIARQILNPLSTAAKTANRIAQGDFLASIPKGGAGETGILLRAMAVMQARLHQMVEQEAAQRLSAQNRLVSAVEGAHDGVLLADAEGRIVIANSQVATFFPSIAEMLLPGTPLAAVLRRATERPGGRRSADDWPMVLSSDGEMQLDDGRWLHVSQSTTQEGGLFLVLSDITPIKEREESLKAARRAAEAASIAKTNFLANMGHELRTPLNAVIGFSEIIASEQFGPVGSDQYREYAGDIMASGRHLLAIINDVLDLAKSADGKLRANAEDVDLGAIVEDCARIVSASCGEAGLKLGTEPPSPPLLVRGDEAKLRQILLNLLSNAIKFSPSGGRITISARATLGDMAELVVADTGIGMRAEDIPIALEPFGQLDNALARRYEGVGLGLPLTKALVDLHDGQIEIDSVPGEGTRVRILLKIADQAARLFVAQVA